MTHCRGETLEENTRWRSSQVAGDSTAQTVMTRSMAFMPDIPRLVRWLVRSNGYHEQLRRWQPDVSQMPENCPADPVPGWPRRPTALKIDAEDKPRLVTFEIDEIERRA